VLAFRRRPVGQYPQTYLSRFRISRRCRTEIPRRPRSRVATVSPIPKRGHSASRHPQGIPAQPEQQVAQPLQKATQHGASSGRTGVGSMPRSGDTGRLAPYGHRVNPVFCDPRHPLPALSTDAGAGRGWLGQNQGGAEQVRHDNAPTPPATGGPHGFYTGCGTLPAALRPVTGGRESTPEWWVNTRGWCIGLPHPGLLGDASLQQRALPLTL
jgi:hypothetical protein